MCFGLATVLEWPKGVHNHHMNECIMFSGDHSDRSNQPLADALQTFIAPCSDDGTAFDLSWIYSGK